MIRLASFISGICAALALVFFAPHLLKDNPAKGSYWIAKVLTYQDSLLDKQSGKKRLIFIGGSNGLYGFDGNYLEKHADYDVINLSVHLGFDLPFHEQRLRGKLREGDVVVAAFEHPLYRRDSTTSFHQEQNLLWLQRFFSYDTPLERLISNLETPSEIYANLTWARLRNNPRDLAGLDVVGNDGIETPHIMAKMKPLHVSLADEHGFFVVPLSANDKVKKAFKSKKRPYSLLPVSAAGPTRAVEKLLELKKSVEAQSARLLITWPAMADIKSHSRHDPSLIDEYRKFQTALNQTGLKMICDPANMFLPPAFFSDTVYHVNAWGALDRSIRLAKCLHQENIGFPDMVMTHTIESQLPIRRTRKSMRAPFEVAQEEIGQLQAALQTYRTEHGAYPMSSRKGRDWDGLYSKWGQSTENWIDGLAPKYVSALPRDWRRSKSPDYQYLYRSNGRFYKIMNRRPPDCELARLIMPGFVDPSRDCWAYSAWVGIARTW
jgi:hypothetical protein